MRARAVFFLSFSFVLGLANCVAQITSLDSMHPKQFNLTQLDVDPVQNVNNSELHDLVPASFYAHPEFGKVPFNVGIDSVIELIDRRTEYTRTFVKQGTHGQTILNQKAYNPLHYLDQAGWWRTIDERLHPSAFFSGLYEANAQLSPTFIDVTNGVAGVKNGNSVLKFNSNISLYHEDTLGNRTLLANANWSNRTVGSEGVKVIDIFPGIDLEMIVSGGKIKSNYIIKTPMSYPNGWLVIEDHPTIPTGETAAFSSSIYDPNGLNFSEIDVKDASNNLKFVLSPAVGYDQSLNPNSSIPFGEKFSSSHQWDIYIPVSWTGNSSLQFPLVVDPLVTSSATSLLATVFWSMHQPAGLFTTSCNYAMAVPTPANCQITDVQWSFNYLAQNGAALCYGAIDLLVGACRSPGNPAAYWFCNTCFFAGTCTGNNISIWSDVSTCIPAPQCLSYNLNCTLRFYARAIGSPLGCQSFFICANSNWVMTITGQTVAHPLPPTSSAGTTICPGGCTTLTATGTWGVPPYTYMWNPGAVSGNPFVVCPPNGTTTYTCDITDACGNVATNSVAITATGCLPVELLTFTGYFDQSDHVMLDWSTATETNNDYFVIERSLDGISFESIGTVNTKAIGGNSTTRLDYSFVDQQAFLNGNSYYRLRQTDKNGQNKISPVITVNLTPKYFSGLSLKPNPADQSVQVGFSVDQAGVTEIQLFDYTGRKVKQLEFNSNSGQNTFDIELSDLNQGFYFVRVTNGNQELNGKLIRK